MRWFGINTPTDTQADSARLKASGATIVRQVATGRPELGAWITTYRNLGLDVVLVLANESRETCPDPVNWVQWYAARYAGQIAAVQCGNEPDGQHGGSSAVATLEQVDALIVACEAFRQVNPACLLIGPGLISGQPQWLAQLRQLHRLDAIAVHPYWKPADQLRGFLDGYRQYTPTKPIWLTEYDPRPDLAYAAAQIDYVDAAIPYCWQRWSEWHLALVDEAGNPTPLYGQFQATKETIMPTFQVSPEMVRHMADNGDAPLGDEVYRTDTVIQGRPVKISDCPGSKGLYTYSNQSNRVYVTPVKA